MVICLLLYTSFKSNKRSLFEFAKSCFTLLHSLGFAWLIVLTNRVAVFFIICSESERLLLSSTNFFNYLFCTFLSFIIFAKRALNPSLHSNKLASDWSLTNL